MRTCVNCGEKFEASKFAAPERQQYCKKKECQRARKAAQNKRYYDQRTRLRNEQELEVILPDGHKVYPVLAEATHMKADIRLALTALRLGKTQAAIAVLSKYEWKGNG